MERLTSGCEWRHAPEAHARRILGILKKSVELSLAVRRRKVTFACSPRPWAGVARDGGGGGRWKKSQNRKNVYLSPYVKEPLNSKLIKFRTWTKKSQVFFVFRDSSILCISIWTWYVYFAYPYHGFGTQTFRSNVGDCFSFFLFFFFFFFFFFMACQFLLDYSMLNLNFFSKQLYCFRQLIILISKW